MLVVNDTHLQLGYQKQPGLKRPMLFVGRWSLLTPFPTVKDYLWPFFRSFVAHFLVLILHTHNFPYRWHPYSVPMDNCNLHIFNTNLKRWLAILIWTIKWIHTSINWLNLLRLKPVLAHIITVLNEIQCLKRFYWWYLKLRTLIYFFCSSPDCDMIKKLGSSGNIIRCIMTFFV